MAVLDIVQGQSVEIPAIQLTNGKVFAGQVRATQDDTLAIELDKKAGGFIPAKVDSNCVLTWKNEGRQHACPVLVRSKSSRAIVVQIVIQERREAPRLRAEVRVAYEVVPADRIGEIAGEVMSRINPLGEPVSESSRLLNGGIDDPLEGIRKEIVDLRAQMDLINQKLDQLTQLTLAVLNGDKVKPSLKIKKPLSMLNCSSTGLGFVADEAYEEGQYLRLHLTLCTVPQVEIGCMGVVVRSTPMDALLSDPRTARFDTGVRYTHIHESDREHLIHYLFKVQRRLLRDMKEARDEKG